MQPCFSFKSKEPRQVLHLPGFEPFGSYGVYPELDWFADTRDCFFFKDFCFFRGHIVALFLDLSPFWETEHACASAGALLHIYALGKL